MPSSFGKSIICTLAGVPVDPANALPFGATIEINPEDPAAIADPIDVFVNDPNTVIDVSDPIADTDTEADPFN